MSGDQASYSVVITTWNSATVLKRCLDSLETQTLDGPLETLVVDNASTDETLDLLRQRESHLRVIRSSRNLGYSAGMNEGARHATGDVLFLVNSDTEFLDATALQELADAIAQPHVGLVAPAYVNADGGMEPTCSGHPGIGKALILTTGAHRALPDRALARLAPSEWSHDRSLETECLMGAVLGIRADLFAALGGFWPIVYATDGDLAYRVGQRGLAVRYVHGARVCHIGSHSTNKRWSAGKRAAKVAESELVFLAAHYSRWRASAIRLITSAGYALRAIVMSPFERHRSRGREYAAMARVYARGAAMADLQAARDHVATGAGAAATHTR